MFSVVMLAIARIIACVIICDVSHGPFHDLWHDSCHDVTHAMTHSMTRDVCHNPCQDLCHDICDGLCDDLWLILWHMPWCIRSVTIHDMTRATTSAMMCDAFHCLCHESCHCSSHDSYYNSYHAFDPLCHDVWCLRPPLSWIMQMFSVMMRDKCQILCHNDYRLDAPWLILTRIMAHGTWHNTCHDMANTKAFTSMPLATFLCI